MAADTQSTIPVVDGGGTTRNFIVGQDASANDAYQVIPRINGSMVSTSNPIPVTNTATVTVDGAGAVGSAPINPPLSISGVDNGGLKRHLLTDVNGVTQTNQITSAGTDHSFGVTAVSGTALATIPANAARLGLQIQNQGLVTLIAVEGTVPGTQWVIGPASTDGGQGSDLLIRGTSSVVIYQSGTGTPRAAIREY